MKRIMSAAQTPVFHLRSREGGAEENPRCFAVAVGLDGAFRRAAVPQGSYQEFELQWAGAQTLRATRAGRSVELQTR